jgi:hypothetical protein
VIIEIDDEKTEQQEKLLEEKRNIMRYINQQQNQQWAKYDEITNCCCLTALCLPSIAQIIEPFTTITTEEISLLSVFSAGAFVAIIDRYAKPNLSREQNRVREVMTHRQSRWLRQM